MPQSCSRIILHTLFSTENRVPIIDKALRGELHAYMVSLFQNRGCHVFGINSVPDHIHIVHSLPRTVTLTAVIADVKKFSSAWIKTKGLKYRRFGWQDGYTSYSADYRRLNGLLEYVSNQHDHRGYMGEKCTL